jgi:glycosyltransferase involved in cell wall biosynthesis
MISVSVIIPTHNRAALLPRTLESLARQTLPASDYELIVVADGCTDGTMQILRSWKAPYALTSIEQTPGRGAAAARNAGAARASADLLIFLDDDMEASPQLLSEHVRSHRQRPGCVVLGYFPMQPPAHDDDVFTKAARIWWADEFANRSQRGYRYPF